MIKNRWLFRVCVAVFTWCACGVPLVAQNYVVSPVVPDFTDLEANCVVVTHGSVDNPFVNQGIQANRHQVITVQGTDENTGVTLQFLPAGEAKVVKLGNAEVGREAESITYHFVVDPFKPVMLLKFAVVFQDPSHPSEAQPRFVVRILNSEGDLMEECAEYDVSARAEIEGFQTFYMNGTPVRWRDWTQVGLDMSRFAGQEVQVQFVTYDCDYSGHFGYAYFTASCISNQLELKACNGDQFTVEAPEGFASYSWSNGQTTPVSQWVRQEERMNISCEIVSVTGCHFILNAYVSGGELPGETEIRDTICQGETYTRYNYNLPVQEESGNYTYYNNYFDFGNCRASGLTTLYLTVLQRYYPLEKQICEGEDYVSDGFSYIGRSAGIYRDTLIFDRPERCDSVAVLTLTILPRVEMKGEIRGEARPCVGSVLHYSMEESWEEGTFSWTFPVGYQVLNGQGTADVMVQVTDAAQAGEVYLLYGVEGCASGIRPFQVQPNPAYWPTVLDTICTGVEYHSKGFDIPVRDSAGLYIYTLHDKTLLGCDSITTLYLYVFNTPEVRILATDSVICEGEEILLRAMGKGGKFVAAPVPLVAVGDIYCEDGAIVKPGDYDPAIHRAEGVVFWINPENTSHGWLVSLANEKNEGNKDQWNWLVPRYEGDVWALQNYYSSYNAVKDTAGYSNTFYMRKAATPAISPVFWQVDFGHGWYIPAAGQMSQLFAAIFEVNPSLNQIGGEPIATQIDEDQRYWTSTECNSQQAWNITMWSGFVSTNSKWSEFWVRAIKSF